MKESDIILTPLPQADGTTKTRPALLLRERPPFGDCLGGSARILWLAREQENRTTVCHRSPSR